MSGQKKKEEQKIALIFNANLPIAKEVARLFAQRGLKIYALDTESLFYVNELLINNPEFEDSIIPIQSPKNEIFSKLQSLMEEEGDKIIDLVMDFNLSTSDLKTEDLEFSSKLLASEMVNSETIFCFGNGYAIKSAASFEQINLSIKKIQQEVQSKYGDDCNVINLVSRLEPNIHDLASEALKYLESLIRTKFKVKKLNNWVDLACIIMYYGLPLSGYSYIEKVGQLFNDWTSPSLKENDSDLIL
ncbi:hypothetical protein BRETT_000329 [Brettanomyces bruxellensis]|uniref:Uncharacterized protein n=1 Tax=Dekkera bruxellensis TaxID=5007 RepID=A0A871R433_DEKBR|nr:uncharacterized protein BRETT_000329 [Brettanomyces bruxellensis]QOU20619.1 hypothetical protein BRETT_000329 [Brettanomyces bruxellensis]